MGLDCGDGRDGGDVRDGVYGDGPQNNTWELRTDFHTYFIYLFIFKILFKACNKLFPYKRNLTMLKKFYILSVTAKNDN